MQLDLFAPARLRLVTGPAGSGKTHAALERVRQAATTGAASRTLLILPTYAQVNHVKRVALSRWDVRGIVDTPFATFTSAGERFLRGFRVRALPSAEERDRLMEEALRQREVEPFQEIRDRPGFRAHLLRLVKELKQTGLEGGEVREKLAGSRANVGAASRVKLDAFLEVFECYEDLLERAGLADHEDTLRRLVDELEQHPPRDPPTLLAVDGFDDFTRVEERILEALADRVAATGGEVLVTLPWDPARTGLFKGSSASRDRLLRGGFIEEPLGELVRARGGPLARLASGLFGPQRPALDGADAVQMLVAGDAEDEAETVARTVRRVVQSGEVAGVRGWRDVGVIARRLDEQAPRIESAFGRIGVPLRVVGAGDVLASRPLVRALRGPLGVIAGDTEAGHFSARGLIEWLRWRALFHRDAEQAGHVDAWDMDLRKRGMPADLAAFTAAVPQALAHVAAEVGAARDAIAQASGSLAVYDALADAIVSLAPLPAPSGFDTAGRPLDRAHDVRLAEAAAARTRLEGILGLLRGAAERTGVGGARSAREAVHELGDALERTTIRMPDRRLDAVTLMDAEEARFWELPLVVVIGLEEGMFPLRPREDVLLRDTDRKALRKTDDRLRLPLARDREARERRLFYGAVTRAKQRLYLARRAYDDKGGPREPSFFLRELETVVEPTAKRASLAPGRVARRYDECFDARDWRRYAAARLGPWCTHRRTVSAEDRDLARAIQRVSASPVPRRVAVNHRRAVGAVADPALRERMLKRFRRETEVVSVSALNHAVVCPRRFFLSYVANVPEDDLALDGPVFDLRAHGTALHKAFELAMEDEQATSDALADAAVAHVGARGFDAELLRSEIRRAVDLLRDREATVESALAPWPEGIELDFRGDRAIALGPEDTRFRLSGRIDRVDRAGKRASVIDYKRSGSSAERGFRRGRDGVDLQLPLYARALEVMEDVEVVGLEWMAGLARARRIIHDADADSLFTGRRETQTVVVDNHTAFRERIEGAEDRAAIAVRAARAGARERSPKEATCWGDDNDKDACPWRHVCRPDMPWIRRGGEEA